MSSLLWVRALPNSLEGAEAWIRADQIISLQIVHRGATRHGPEKNSITAMVFPHDHTTRTLAENLPRRQQATTLLLEFTQTLAAYADKGGFIEFVDGTLKITPAQ